MKKKIKRVILIGLGIAGVAFSLAGCAAGGRAIPQGRQFEPYIPSSMHIPAPAPAPTLNPQQAQTIKTIEQATKP